MKKSIKALILAGALCLTFVSGAMASGNETISALLNRSITINYNGTTQSFVDANNDAVYPISYNGTTYLPIRSVADLVGIEVDYEASTDTVILGSTEKQPTSITSLAHTAGTSYSSIILDADELSVVGDSATMSYSNGILWHQWNSAASYSKARDIDFTVDGYSTLTFTIWSDVSAYARVYDEDGGVLATYEVAPGTITTKTIDISGQDIIAFGSDGTGYGNDYNGYVKFLGITVS